MSTVVKSEAIVLRSVDIRESSKIVTFYTRQWGKISGIVKGARQAKSKYGSSLEPMSYVSLVIYKKEGRDVQTVSQCDIIKPFRKLYDDLDKMSVGMAVIELVNIVAHEQEQNVNLFALLQRLLSSLNTATQSPQILLYYFEVQLAKVLGFEPVFNHCVSCNKELKEILNGYTYKIHVEKGGLICSKCSAVHGDVAELRSDVLKIFQTISTSNNIEEILSIELNKKIEDTMQAILWAYLRYHVSGLRTLKSDRVFAKIFNGLEKNGLSA